MMPSDEPSRAYVWIWLPAATAPVVAGVLEPTADILYFTYGQSYLERDPMTLYLPELPLLRGRQPPLGGMRVAGVISDAGPDAWGQRVLLHRLLGSARGDTDPAELGLLTYLLESASDRTGALDFQRSNDTYVARGSTATLEEMMSAAERLEAGEPFAPELDAALLGGSSLGGARPKVALDDNGRKLIAKLSSLTDTYPVVKSEGLAMELARRVGIAVPRTEVIECLGRDVLLVERFDRTSTPGERKSVVSALTILELDEQFGRYATYHDLADAIRERFNNPAESLRELFKRIVFNICVGNTDDHARNHAAFWDGAALTLTPAYDITPQPRSGGEATQAMEIGKDGFRMSQLAGCVKSAGVYLLSPAEAIDLIDAQLEVIRVQSSDAADAARLSQAERRALWGRQILNPFALEGYPPSR